MKQALAPNKQAEQSIEIQNVELPSDLPLAAIQSPGMVSLCRLEGGSLMLEFSDTLREVVASSYNLNKKASIRLEIEFRPGGKNRMEIVPKISAKIPKEERASTSLFCTADGQLLAHDPDQARLPLKVMKFTDTPSKVIDVEETTARKIV